MQHGSTACRDAWLETSGRREGLAIRSLLCSLILFVPLFSFLFPLPPLSSLLPVLSFNRPWSSMSGNDSYHNVTNHRRQSDHRQPHTFHSQPTLERSWGFSPDPGDTFGSGGRPLSLLTEGGVSWDRYSGLVESIVALANSSHSITQWGRSVTKPFRQQWSQEQLITQDTLYRRLKTVHQRLSEQDHCTESLVFDGVIVS